MQNFKFTFAYPWSGWLLLLIIPAVAFTLIPYFRLSKRYRRTRNRITSIVLHLIVMVLSIFVLSGLGFDYDIPNKKNEIILLVDMSQTEELSAEARNDFIDTVLKDSRYDNYNVGVVTFGYDQVYAVPITADVDSIYDKYMDAELPDTSATNVAAALEYTKDLFRYPSTATIVLVTDAKETDEEALKVIGTIANKGITVNTAFVPSAYSGEDAMITNVELPKHYVGKDVNCSISVTVQSNYVDLVHGLTLRLYDNNVLKEETGKKTLLPNASTQIVTFDHQFTQEGLHEIRVELDSADLEGNNNVYSSYYNLVLYNKILLLERVQDEGLPLENLLKDNGEYDITRLEIMSDEVPKTVDELRAYDQVILNNIANRDMPDENFAQMLEIYVGEFGGGLFTVAGHNGTETKTDEEGNPIEVPIANLYDREDLNKTVYQSMLPVVAEDYVPPLGVIFIIDRSGSMSSETYDGTSYLEWAKGAVSNAIGDGSLAQAGLNPRDWVGIMTLDTEYNTILELTSCQNSSIIFEAINNLEDATGGTSFAGAIERAGQQLSQLQNVDKKHIIVVSDCMVPKTEEEFYMANIKNNYENHKITFSVVGLGRNDSSSDQYSAQMEAAVEAGHGRYIAVPEGEISSLSKWMTEELNVPELEEVNYKPFNPYIEDTFSPLVDGLDRLVIKNEEAPEGEEQEDVRQNQLSVTLNGFYGVRARDSAEVVLTGEYGVPLYAQWNYGSGRVGSFMCDLMGYWSADFMADPNGIKFVCNVVNNLMPIVDIRPNEIGYTLKEDNYTNTLSVFNTTSGQANVVNGQYIIGTISYTNDDGESVSVSLNKKTEGTPEELRELDVYVIGELSPDTLYSTAKFAVRKGGVYTIVLEKYAQDNTPIDSRVIYKEFAYSEEFDTLNTPTEDELKELMVSWANKGNGSYIEDLEDPVEIFENFITKIHKRYDPRTLFMILAIILFLLDIAVRKFKFKWLHEIIRDHKDKKAQK